MTDCGLGVADCGIAIQFPIRISPLKWLFSEPSCRYGDTLKRMKSTTKKPRARRFLLFSLRFFVVDFLNRSDIHHEQSAHRHYRRLLPRDCGFAPAAREPGRHD